MRKSLTKIFWNIEVWAVQKHVNIVDLVKSFPTNILLQNLASIQKRTSPLKICKILQNLPILLTLTPHRSSAQSGGRLPGGRRGPTGARSSGPPSAGGGASARVERFDRRGTEPFEPFEPFELFQNRNYMELWWIVIIARKFKNFRKCQHFLSYRRHSDKISSKSEQKSVKRIQK